MTQVDFPESKKDVQHNNGPRLPSNWLLGFHMTPAMFWYLQFNAGRGSCVCFEVIQLRVILRFKRHMRKGSSKFKRFALKESKISFSTVHGVSLLPVSFTERTAVGQILFTQEVIGVVFFPPKHFFLSARGVSTLQVTLTGLFVVWDLEAVKKLLSDACTSALCLQEFRRF